jgi:hypothetical protein
VSRNLVAVSTPLRNTPDDKQHVWSFDEQDIAGLLPWGEPEITVVGSTIIATISQ